ncbi:MAG: M28 family peptidase, partial [Caldilineaceae bacterium]|nr:M28 family peptidase [Caldilineaceae bacterium]
NATHLAATIGPRPAGTTGEQQAAAWLATQFTNLGYAVTVEPFIFSRWGEQTVGMNVVAVKAGQPDYGTIYLGAHYDAVPQPANVPGANDNASGVGVLVEAARILAGQPISPTLTLIAFGAEEDHLVGSHVYTANLSAVERMLALGMFNLDCVGIGDQLALNVAARDQLAFAQGLGVTADTIEYAPDANSDHVRFATVGIPAVYFNLSYAGQHACGPDYHSPGDTADKLELAALERSGTALLTAVETLAQQATPQPIRHLYLPLLQAAAASDTAALPDDELLRR